jgi:Peptidase propeptide and YPEB domain
LSRRQFILLLLAASGAFPAFADAWAKDGDSGGSGSSGSGSSGSGSSGSGSSGSGSSGSGSSGSGGSDDDGGDDDGGDDGDGNSGSGSGSSGSGSGKRSEQDRVRNAVANGKALSLEEALKRLRIKFSGRVIDVALRKEGSRLVYSFKVKTDAGYVRKVVMDAATGQVRGLFGF